MKGISDEIRNWCAFNEDGPLFEDDCGGTPKYGATMSRDGETWICEYDYGFGAGFDDIH